MIDSYLPYTSSLFVTNWKTVVMSNVDSKADNAIQLIWNPCCQGRTATFGLMICLLFQQDLWTFQSYSESVQSFKTCCFWPPVSSSPFVELVRGTRSQVGPPWRSWWETMLVTSHGWWVWAEAWQQLTAVLSTCALCTRLGNVWNQNRLTVLPKFLQWQNGFCCRYQHERRWTTAKWVHWLQEAWHPNETKWGRTQKTCSSHIKPNDSHMIEWILQYLARSCNFHCQRNTEYPTRWEILVTMSSRFCQGLWKPIPLGARATSRGRSRGTPKAKRTQKKIKRVGKFNRKEFKLKR